MEHRIAHRKLSRTTSHRMAMLRNMVSSLIEHERITTTIPKAKEARRLAERVITLGKRGGVANVRLASKTVPNRVLLQKVFGELKDRYSKRPGGYTRLVRLGFRRGDAVEVALLELVDRPVVAAPEAPAQSGSVPAKAATPATEVAAPEVKKPAKKKAKKTE